MTLSLEYEYVNGQLVSGCFIGNSNVYLFMYLVFPCPSIFIDSRNFDPSNFGTISKTSIVRCVFKKLRTILYVIFQKKFTNLYIFIISENFQNGAQICCRKIILLFAVLFRLFARIV